MAHRPERRRQPSEFTTLVTNHDKALLRGQNKRAARDDLFLLQLLAAGQSDCLGWAAEILGIGITSCGLNRTRAQNVGDNGEVDGLVRSGTPDGGEAPMRPLVVPALLQLVFSRLPRH